MKMLRVAAGALLLLSGILAAGQSPGTGDEATEVISILRAAAMDADPITPIVAPPIPARDISQQCARGDLPRNACRFHWRSALKQSGLFLAAQQAGNIVSTPSVRYELTHGNFFRKWGESVSQYRFSRWSDGDPYRVDYVAHPMMGAVSGRIYVQNDPRSMTLEIGKSGLYWKSRLRAMAWTAAYTAQWELGPLSESSIGNTGRFTYWSETSQKMTNGTGMTDLVTTPVAGTALLVIEDAIDRHMIRRLEDKSSNPAWLLAISVLNPCRSAANLLRLQAPWHRDDRLVRRNAR